ncbi:MAG: antitoxin [Actinobacteria bacterium]|nr:MAG: antitoxin [Actinomycetota bacterium]REK36109.1 MAG: antitoxin [Actinomycetota bacterium]
MGLGDMVDKAKDLASENADSVKEGIEKAADFVDDKTGGEYSEQIDTGADKAKEAVDKLDD